MSKVTTGPVQVALVEKATGAQVLRWPVDAREMLASGDYVSESDYASYLAEQDAKAAEAAAAAKADADAKAKADADAKKGK